MSPDDPGTAVDHWSTVDEKSSTDPEGPAVIVDPYSSGALFPAEFAAAGVPVVAVTTGPAPPAVYASSYRPEDFTEILVCHGDPAPVLRRLRELRPRCVIPGCESGVELADQLAPLVTPGTANVPSLAPARRDKAAMAEAVAAAGLPIIRQIASAEPDEVRHWIEEQGLSTTDLVVKPPKSASTDGVTKVPGGGDWRAVFDAQLGRANRLGLVNERLVVQEYARGTEYVVDTFSHPGGDPARPVHTVTDVCRYHKVDNGPHMAIYESMRWVEPDDPAVAVVTGYARAVLDAVGLRFGAAHVEIMLTADGPRLIEIGARPHGGGHPRFCRVATGDSQVARTVRWLTGAGGIDPGYRLHRQMRVVFLLSRTDQVARDVGALERVRELAGHHESVIAVRQGDLVPATRDLFGSLDLGFVVLTGTDPARLATEHEAVRAAEAAMFAGTPAMATTLTAL